MTGEEGPPNDRSGRRVWVITVEFPVIALDTGLAYDSDKRLGCRGAVSSRILGPSEPQPAPARRAS